MRGAVSVSDPSVLVPGAPRGSGGDGAERPWCLISNSRSLRARVRVEGIFSFR